MKNIYPRQINTVFSNLEIYNLPLLKKYINTPKMYFDLPLYQKQLMWARLMNVRPILLCFERCFNMYDIELPSELIYMILGFFKLEEFISI